MPIRGLRALVVAGGLLVLALPASLTQAVAPKPASAAAAPACPTFDSSNFHSPTTITNPYFPLTPGDLYTYSGYRKRVPVVDTVYVTKKTPTKDGIRTVQVRDRVYESGVLTEDTLDWYAQDDQGNVWYMGEFSTELPSGDHAGSWTAGVDGAQPGSTSTTRRASGCWRRSPSMAVARTSSSKRSSTTNNDPKPGRGSRSHGPPGSGSHTMQGSRPRVTAR